MATDEIDEIKREFGLLDEDQTGTIELSEMADILRMLDPSWEDKSIKGLFSCLDKDKNGHINITEFIDYIFDCGESRFLTAEDEEKLKGAGRTVPSDFAPGSLTSLLRSVNQWKYSRGEYGEKDSHEDWSVDATQLKITRDLQFELFNSAVGNNPSGYGGGYEFKVSETYTGICGIVQQVSSGKAKIHLKPSSIKLHNHMQPHTGHKARTLHDQKDFTSGTFTVLVSAKEAVIQEVPEGVTLHGTILESTFN